MFLYRSFVTGKLAALKGLFKMDQLLPKLLSKF